jgi:hypothetical protein
MYLILFTCIISSLHLIFGGPATATANGGSWLVFIPIVILDFFHMHHLLTLLLLLLLLLL